MSRTVGWLIVILISGCSAVAWWADQQARGRDSAPAGQNSHPVTVYAPATRQPMPEGLAHLQFLADAVRCPVSDRSAIMASCVVERYQKMRDKALSARARYEALVGLERAYWAALAREGLTQRVEHVSSKEKP